MEDTIFDFSNLQELVERLIVYSVNALSDVCNTIGEVVPNPDPFPAFIENMYIDDGSPGAMAFFYINNFVDIPTILAIFSGWFLMFAFAWIIQMLWKLTKMKNKG